MHGQQEPVEALQQRVAALEAMLAQPSLRSRSDRHRYRFLTLATVLLPIFAFTSWAVAQQGTVPAPPSAPAPAPAPAPAEDVIRKVGGVTQVAAPFEVIDPSGKVILSVAADSNSSALTSISNVGGLGGNVTVSSSGGVQLATLGINTAGHGTVFVNNAEGNPMAFMQGLGALYVHNKSGKQVAGMVTTSEDKGRVAVWGSHRGERIAELDEDAAGSGAVRIYDSGHKQIARVGADENGKGTVFIVDQDHTAAALSINNAGAGQLLLSKPDGSLGLEAVGTSQRSGYGPGGVMAAFGDDGNVVAGFGVGPNGKGMIAIANEGRQVGELSVNNAGAGELNLRSAEGNDGLTATGATSEGPGGGLVASNGSGDPVVALGPSRSGKGLVTIFERDRAAAELSTNDAGAGQLTLNNAEGGAALDASGGTPELPGGGVVAFNKEGIPVISMGSSAEGKGELTIAEKARDVAKLTSNTASAGALYLMTSDGKAGLDANGQLATGQSGGSVTAYNGQGDAVATLGTQADGKGMVQITEQDKPVAKMWFGPNGGVFNAMNTEGDRVAGMGSDEGGKGRVAVYGKTGGLATLSDANGSGEVWVKNSEDKIVAGITSTASGEGAVIVTNGAGATLAQMSTTTDGRGEIKVLDAGGARLAVMAQASDSNGGALEVYSGKVAVVNIRPGASGGGYIQLLDAGGRSAVEAGVSPDGIGVVRAGPKYKCGSNYLGLKIPDCIVGLP